MVKALIGLASEGNGMADICLKNLTLKDTVTRTPIDKKAIADIYFHPVRTNVI